MSAGSRYDDDERSEDGDLGLGHGCQPGSLPPFQIMRRHRPSSTLRRSPEPSALRDSDDIGTVKRPTNPLTQLTSKLGFHSKSKHGLKADGNVLDQPACNAVVLGTSLKQQKRVFDRDMTTIQRRRSADLQQLGISAGSSAEKSFGVSTDAQELSAQLQSTQAEVERLRQQLELCEKNLNQKRETVKILLQQLELASTNEQLNRANEQNMELIKALNKVQFELEHNQSSLLLSQQTWAARFDSVCNDKLALEAAVDQLSQEKKLLYAEKMSVSRERDELIALLNARERHCFDTLSFVGQNDASSCCSTDCRHRTDGTTLKMAVIGSCQCFSADSGPCSCAQLAAEMMHTIAHLNDKLDDAWQKHEESLVMADSFRIAFEEQLSRNRSLAGQLIKLHSPRRPRSRFIGSRSTSCVVSETLSSSDEEEDVILSLTEMVSESREALAHQRFASRLLALRTQQLENKLLQASDDCGTPDDVGGSRESYDVDDKLSPVSVNDATPCDTGHLDESDEVKTVLPVSASGVTPTSVCSMQDGAEEEDKLSTWVV